MTQWRVYLPKSTTWQCFISGYFFLYKRSYKNLCSLEIKSRPAFHDLSSLNLNNTAENLEKRSNMILQKKRDSYDFFFQKLVNNSFFCAFPNNIYLNQSIRRVLSQCSTIKLCLLREVFEPVFKALLCVLWKRLDSLFHCTTLCFQGLQSVLSLFAALKLCIWFGRLECITHADQIVLVLLAVNVEHTLTSENLDFLKSLVSHIIIFIKFIDH